MSTVGGNSVSVHAGGELEAWVAALAVPAGALGRPVYVETSEPSVARRVIALTPPMADGKQTPVYVVSVEGVTMSGALEAAGPEDELRQARVRVISGASAGQDLLAELIQPERLDLNLHGACLVQPGLTRRVIAGAAVGVEGIVGAAMRQQSSVLAHLSAKNASAYGSRTKAWWAARFAEARTGRGAPLRVLLATTRYSTFVKHSTADMVVSLERMGCVTRTLIEPDDHSTLTSVAYARAIAEHQPDLMIVINYTRAHLGGPAVIPAQLPLVCWIQDAMRHLFDERVGAALGSMDFTIGHAHPELFTQFGYCARRALALPVPVSTAKFHDGPVSGAQRARFACDIAYVGHQSEPPALMRDRLVSEARAAGAGNAIAPIIERLYPSLSALADAPLTTRLHPAISAATDAAVREVTGREPAASLSTVVLNTIARPLMDRLLRHQALGWADEIARERSLRLHVYGRGWERHPTLARYARGPVEHNDDLRAAYQLAGCHLHATIATGVHQRVLECALSGGLPLVRLIQDDLDLRWSSVAAAVLDRGGADLCAWPHRFEGASISAHPEAIGCAFMLQRLGLPVPAFMRLYNVAAPLGTRAHVALHPEVAGLTGDPAETGFSTLSTLREAVLSAVERPAWRADLSAGMARRGRAHLTYDVAARRVMDFLCASFDGTW